MWTPDAYEGAPTIVTGLHVDRRQGGGVRGVRPRVPARRFEPLQRRLVPGPLGAGRCHDDPRDRRGRGADEPEADARLLEHRARRLPAGRPRGRRTTSGQGAILFYLLVYGVTNLGAFARASRCSARRDRANDDLATAWPASGNRHPALAAAARDLPAVARRVPADGRLRRRSGTSSARPSAPGDYGLAIIGVLTSVVSIFFYLRVIVMMYMAEPGDAPRSPEPSRGGRRSRSRRRWSSPSTSASCRRRLLDLAAQSIGSLF